MIYREYKLIRDVGQNECPWLDQDMKAGTHVYRYISARYGCIGNGWAVTLHPGRAPSFELPRNALELV